jgi:hypothetical protein
MKDLRQSQLSQMHREKRALRASGVDRDRFILQCKAKEHPPGSTHAWALDQVYGPIGSAKKDDRNAA